MKSKTLSGQSIESLDSVVNAYLSSRAVKAVLMSNFFIVGGVFYINLIHTEN